MAPDKRKDGKDREAARQEFEVAYYTKRLERELQRKLLQRQLAQLGDANSTAASHGEESSPERDGAPPREDRAG